MHETALKVEVLNWVRAASAGRALPIVASEFSLNGTGNRADLAILGDAFIGVEIKSAADTLKRLPSQMEGYARYFDHTILVVAPKHVNNLPTLDLRGAQVWVQTCPGERECIMEGTAGRVFGHTLLGLLTADEERRAMRNIQAGAVTSDEAYRQEFEKAFNRRYASTSQAFWKSVRRRPIRSDDLLLLSRFQAERQRGQEAKAAEAIRWTQWAHQMTATVNA